MFINEVLAKDSFRRMEIIRRGTDYGFRALLYLAGPNRGIVPCAELADACGTPKSFAYKVLRKLANRGLVVSHPGRPGGFELCKDPKDICLYDVIEAMQGPLSVAPCVLRTCAYGQEAKCPLSAEWRELQDRIVRFFKQVTLQSVLATTPS